MNPRHISEILPRAMEMLLPMTTENTSEKTADDRFERWWYEEGSGMHSNPGEDTEQHVRRIARIAWSNGAFLAERLFATCKRTITDGQIANLFGERMTTIVNERDELKRRVEGLEAENRANYQARCDAQEVFNRHDIVTEGDVPESIEKLFQQLAAAREDAKRLVVLDYDKDGNSIGYICVFPDRNRALFAPQHGRNVREVIDEARAARKATP